MTTEPSTDPEASGENESVTQDEQVVGNDEGSYGSAANEPEDTDHIDPGSGENRPPSDQDDDQGI